MKNAPQQPRGVLILAGGRGERFWPWSTPERPKQLLPLAKDGRTLLAATFARALRLTTADQVVVMTSEALRDACQRECPGAVILGEPMMRNTAPAIAGAAFGFSESQAFAVLPADHAIDDEDAFTADMERAFALAEREAVLVTFGIPATAPDPNFGYIQRGSALGERLYRVARFTEKPDRAKAAEWLAAGGYSWNSGMFVWGKKTFFDALSVHHPDIAALRAFSLEGAGAAEFAARIRPRFEPLKSISVDYAVLEHAPNTVVLEATFDWDDLGSWQAWARRQPRDARGNVAYGAAVPVECDRCIVVGDGVTAAPLGLSDMVVVATRDGVLACRIEDSEQVRKVSEAVRACGRSCSRACSRSPAAPPRPHRRPQPRPRRITLRPRLQRRPCGRALRTHARRSIRCRAPMRSRCSPRSPSPRAASRPPHRRCPQRPRRARPSRRRPRPRRLRRRATPSRPLRPTP